MALNFSANQFEREFKAKRLGNWEVPKWYPDRPRAPRKTPTRIICNNKGHLLPGIPRSNISPWGRHYVGTWDLPNKITRRVATELSQQPHPDQLTAWERRCAHVPFTQPPPEQRGRIPAKERPKTHRSSKGFNELKPSHNHSRPGTPLRAKSSPHIATPHPLAITGHSATSRSSSSSSLSHRSSDSRHGNHANKKHNDGRPYVPGEIYTKESVRKPLVPPPTPPNIPGYVSPARKPKARERKQPSGPPLANAYSNFVVAKQFHQGNLQHQPLPDTIEDATYRKMQAQGSKYPGLGLDVEPEAAAVGWRGYGAPGPTQCSKLRVYRPKTAGIIPDIEGPDPPIPGRPSTSVKRTKLHRQNGMSEMELAICWDLHPLVGEEAKQTVHIDGTNETAGPAVFTVVHQQPQPDCVKVDGGMKPSPLINPSKKKSIDSSNSLTPETAAKLRVRPKTAWNENGQNILQERLEKISNNQENNNPNLNHRHRHSASRRSGSVDRKSSPKGDDTIDSSGLDSNTLAKRKHYRSSPNLIADDDHKNHTHDNLPAVKSKMLNRRPCMACELKPPPPDPTRLLIRPKSEYKMAFKAGKPSNSFDSGSGTNTRPTTGGKPVKVPKPKQYTKRSYSIDTLAPPFSLWPSNNGRGLDYPEHWRLASVYQHAYKPVELRKKPLLASVYQ